MSESRATTVDCVKEIRALVCQAENCMSAIKSGLAYIEHESNLSAVTLAKAAETDRLTDENRALRRKVDDLEAKVESGPPVDDLQSFTAEKNDSAEVLPGPDYVTRAELMELLTSENWRRGLEMKR